jgi:hypothetical protein
MDRAVVALKSRIGRAVACTCVPLLSGGTYFAGTFGVLRTAQLTVLTI